MKISATILKSSVESASGSFSHLDLEWTETRSRDISDEHGVEGVEVPAEHSKLIQDEQLRLLGVSFTVGLQQLLFSHNLRSQHINNSRGVVDAQVVVQDLEDVSQDDAQVFRGHHRAALSTLRRVLRAFLPPVGQRAPDSETSLTSFSSESRHGISGQISSTVSGMLRTRRGKHNMSGSRNATGMAPTRVARLSPSAGRCLQSNTEIDTFKKGVATYFSIKGFFPIPRE
ncbi:hypothetical protein EYF80_029153 [Liparis tanakae]|uniref:Uncharacterized protein n=1 Tax=Liparis tanakae TaxID=230148 RepID=A0A4Z2H5B9_9TELE|nr:hypothetical protein EYF80_029153 [Liparis tanakae]